MAKRNQGPGPSVTSRGRNRLPANTTERCRCGNKAAVIYSNVKMCGPCADARARYDES